MAQLIFTEADRTLVAELLADADPSRDVTAGALIGTLEPAFRERILSMIARHLTTKIKTCIAARAHYDFLVQNDLLDEKGRDAYFWGHDVSPGVVNQGVAKDGSPFDEVSQAVVRFGNEFSNLWTWLEQVEDRIDARIFGDVSPQYLNRLQGVS